MQNGWAYVGLWVDFGSTRERERERERERREKIRELKIKKQSPFCTIRDLKSRNRVLFVETDGRTDGRSTLGRLWVDFGSKRETYKRLIRDLKSRNRVQISNKRLIRDLKSRNRVLFVETDGRTDGRTDGPLISDFGSTLGRLKRDL